MRTLATLALLLSSISATAASPDDIADAYDTMMVDIADLTYDTSKLSAKTWGPKSAAALKASIKTADRVAVELDDVQTDALTLLDAKGMAQDSADFAKVAGTMEAMIDDVDDTLDRLAVHGGSMSKLELTMELDGLHGTLVGLTKKGSVMGLLEPITHR